MNDLISSVNSELLTQVTTGPSLREVASVTLREALRELYPRLDINPDLATVNDPRWYLRDGEIIRGEPHSETLTGLLARSAVSHKPVVCLDRMHFLVYPLGNEPDVHLPVRIDAIARLINELAPLLFVSHQEQQLAFWNHTVDANGPRWRMLAKSLRNVWNVQAVEGWDADDCAVALAMYHYPVYAERLPHDKYGTRAYLVDLDIQDGTTVRHLNVSALSVLIATHGARTIILSHSIGGGYAKFADLEAFGQSLLPYAGNLNGKTLNWRLLEPDGDFFEQQACSVIGLQIEAIGQIGAAPTHRPTQLAAEPVGAQAADLSVINQTRIRSVQRALPSWLLQASETDQSDYGRYLMDLAALTTRNEGKTFVDDLPTLTDFARQALRAQLIKEHPEATHLNVDHVEITVTSQVVWGTVAIPGETQTVTLSLVELALQNLVALPLGNKTVRYRDGSPTPNWMTAAYLDRLVTQADIGKHYPELVNTLLLANPGQVLQRQGLYAEQLRLQLPLLALQYKIRGLFNVDERGYRYVCAVMAVETHQRQVDGYTVEIRPLALRPTWRLGGGADRVENMFIIGPQDPKNGPCLLYRPLSNEPLMQFPSLTNVLYAIKQDTPLRDAVLAWLPDNVRLNYAQFVFPGKVPSPWVLPALLSRPMSSLAMVGPIEFGTQTLGSNYFAALYNANARALLTLADRQSVSNAEARWESFKHAGWIVLNAALPFLGRTAGAAAWIWQIMDDLQVIIDAKESGDRTTTISAVVDIFLNLAMALALHISQRHAPASEPEKPGITPAPALPAKPSILQKPMIETGHLPPGHELTLLTHGALTRSPLGLSHTLDSFSLAKPEGLGRQNTTAGPYLHLYPKGEKWYVPVAQRWFEVTFDENETVLIIDPKNPSREGPALINNLRGQWFVDTRLRLRGGGLRSQRRKGQALRPPKIQELREQLEAFDAQTERRRQQMVGFQTAIKQASPGNQAAARTTYLTEVSARLEELDVPIAKLKSLNILDTVPRYQEAMLSYLEDQIILGQSAATEQLIRFRDGLHTVTEFLDKTDLPDTPMALEDCRAVDTSTQNVIDRIQYMHSRFKEAHSLGFKGAELVQHYEPLLSKVGLDELKAFRITLSRYLCLNDGTKVSPDGAYSVIGQLVDRADLAVQSLCETLQPDNLTPLDEQIEVLDNLVDQFTGVDQSLADLPEDFPLDVHRPSLETLKNLTEEFAQRAVKRLVTLLRERKALEPVSAGPSTSTPRQRVIKTRFKGIVVGEERPPLGAEKTPLVEVKQPLTGKVIAVFHEKDGLWVEHKSPTSPPVRPTSRSLTATIASAQTLFDDTDHFVERTKSLSADVRRLPVEIEERFHRRAGQLEEAGREIEEALTAANLTESTSTSAAQINRNLDTAIKRLYTEGRRVKLDMLKQRPPTAAHVELLYNEKEVTINPIPGSRTKLAGRNKGYLKEYEILDAANSNALWYAHFHYNELVGPEAAYTAAHLKTKAQRRLGGKYQSPGPRDDRGNIAVYRSEIGPKLARSLFFKD
ncbi:dermonecrotic toxin domain-containing protein [Pseudomonas canadensis]|uniref:dermonecrotic toxin domain-containing protein n=1 Tax=Pseudomonas canadensis TaxID=915099 RepID=UPI003BA065B5